MGWEPLRPKVGRTPQKGRIVPHEPADIWYATRAFRHPPHRAMSKKYLTQCGALGMTLVRETRTTMGVIGTMNKYHVCLAAAFDKLYLQSTVTVENTIKILRTTRGEIIQ